MGIVVEAQQLGQFVTQSKDLRHHRAVIPFARVWPLVGGAGAVGAVKLFAQGLVIAVGHHRQIARDVERQQPALLLFGLRLSLGLRQGALRHTGQLRLIGN